ncbi:MAG: hypothetical protein ACWA40_10375 [Planktomarina sp.]
MSVLQKFDQGHNQSRLSQKQGNNPLDYAELRFGQGGVAGCQG